MKRYLYQSCLLLICALWSISPGMATSAVSAQTMLDVSAPEAKTLMDTVPGLVIIDVSPAFRKGHLPGAVNYPLGDGTLENTLPSLDRAQPYLVYCHNDTAAIKGAQKLIDAGFPKVYRLKGNFQGWVDAGFTVEK